MARKLARLPLHHIDTSVILEPEKTENGFYCKKYLNLVGYKYYGKISLPVLGELLFKIPKLERLQDRYELLDLIIDLIKRREIAFYSIPENLKIVNKIRDLDKRIHKVDRLILGCAIVDKANVLVSLDKNLVNNQILEREFKVKLRHPKDLL